MLQLFKKGFDKFIDIRMPEKIIFLNSIGAFFSIILSVAKFYIFETYYFVNNPLAVYMIGIAFIMLVTILRLRNSESSS